MHSVTSSQLKHILAHLPKRFSKEDIKYWEKDKRLINLYDKEQEFITSIDPEFLQETVINLEPKRVGRPAYKAYFVKRNVKRITMCPIGSSWWYYIPYEQPEDLIKFFKDIDAKG